MFRQNVLSLPALKSLHSPLVCPEYRYVQELELGSVNTSINLTNTLTVASETVLLVGMMSGLFNSTDQMVVC